MRSRCDCVCVCVDGWRDPEIKTCQTRRGGDGREAGREEKTLEHCACAYAMQIFLTSHWAASFFFSRCSRFQRRGMHARAGKDLEVLPNGQTLVPDVPTLECLASPEPGIFPQRATLLFSFPSESSSIY